MNDKYRGTTVNERLLLSGNLDSFDKAVEEKNIEEIIRILNNVEITDELAIEQILEALGVR